MKKQKMVFRNIFLTGLAAAALFVMFSCKHSADKAKEKPPVLPSGKVFIEFETQKIECKKDGEAFVSGSEVESGTVLNFSARLKAGERVEKWMVSGADLAGETKENFSYTVSLKDSVETGNKKVVFVDFSKTGGTEKKLFAVEFGKEITCCKTGAELSGLVNAGSEVEEGTALTFTALLEEGGYVKEWLVKNVKQKGQTGKTFNYVVAASDAEKVNGKQIIFVRFTKTNTAPAEKITINFKEEEISCKVPGLISFLDTAVKPGSEVEAGISLIFTAKIAHTEFIEKWLINGKEQQNQKEKELKYKVLAENSVTSKSGKKEISVAFVKKAMPSIFIKYNSSKMSCTKGSLLSSPVPDGSQVNPDDVLYFSAKNKTGETVDKWSLNGKVLNNQTKDALTYKVNFSDAKIENGNAIINIDYTARTLQKVKIIFEKEKLSCNKEGSFLSSGASVRSGELLAEGEKIVFTAKTGKYEDVKLWQFNGKELKENKNTMHYTVSLADVQKSNGENVLNVSYTVKYKVVITYDNKRISCKRKNLLGLLESDVPSGSSCSEGETLYFKVTLLEGEELEGLYLNGKKHTTLLGLIITDLTYSVSAKDAVDKDGKKVINVTAKLNNKPKAKLKFDNTKIECKRGAETLQPDSFIYEKDNLAFTSKLPDTQAIAEWQINGKKRTVNATHKTFSYYVYLSDAVEKNGEKVIEVTIVEKTLEGITVKFGATVTCEKNSSTVNSGQKLKELDEIVLTAAISNEEEVTAWTVNGKDIKDSRKKSIKYVLNKKDSKLEGAENVINIAFKTAKKIVIKFDENLIAAEISDGAWLFPKYEAINSGDFVAEGAALKFTARLNEGENFVKWFINGKEPSSNKNKTLYYSVNVSDAEVEGDKKVITVTFEKK